MIEVEALNKYIDRIRPWPWRLVMGVTIVSFFTASVVSTLLGWWFMSQANNAKPADTIEPTGFTMQPTIGQAKVAADKILERNIFNAEGLTGDVDPNAKGEQMAKTQLPLRVLGIIYGGTPFNGIVMVENTQSKSVNSFMAGDQLTPEAKLLEIQTDMILIDNQGRKEFAQLDEVELRRSSRKGGVKKKANTPVSLTGDGYAIDAPPDSFKEDGFERKGANIELSTEYKSRLLGPDMANLLQDAKASPNMVAGVLKGWRMDRIRKNSFYEKAGMQNGDVVEEINGVVLSDAGQAVATLRRMQTETDIDIKIDRNGQKMTLNLKVK